MTEETKQSIHLALELLRTTLTDGGCSIAIDKKTGDISFFDTAIYLSEKRYDGIKVNVTSLVN